MRLPDPFTHGNLVPGFSEVTLIDNDPMLRDELPNGTVQEVKVASQYWSINIVYPDLFESEYKILDSFILDYKRRGEYIEVLLPQYEKFNVIGDTSLCTIPAGLKGSQITINNVNTLVGTPKLGDLFKLSSNSKVYKIVGIDTSSANYWKLNLYPDLNITTTSSDKPIFNGILFKTKISNPETYSVSLSNDGLYTGFSLSLRESL